MTQSHPTKEEYEQMDNLRFPFMLNKENALKERKYDKFNNIKERKVSTKKNHIKLEERIKKLIHENKEKFFDPISNTEIHPVATRNSGGWINTKNKA